MTDIYRRYTIAHLIIDGPPLQSGTDFEVTLYGQVGPDLDEDAITLRVQDWAGPTRSDYKTAHASLVARRVADEGVSLKARVLPSTGEHHHVQVFAGPDAEHRALCGTLTLREREHRELLGALVAGGVEVDAPAGEQCGTDQETSS